jgi:capsular polysaccharide biosynthesis protein
VRCDELVYADWRATSARDMTYLAPRRALRRIRSYFARSNSNSGGAALELYPRRIRHVVYAARSCAEQDRCVANEPAVIAAIRRVFAATGDTRTRVHVFHGAPDATRDAIRLFRKADVVIGPHGGALANIVFCAASTSVLEFCLSQAWARYFAHLALALDQDYWVLPPRNVTGYNHHMHIDVALLEDTLRAMLRRRADHNTAYFAKDEL